MPMARFHITVYDGSYKHLVGVTDTYDRYTIASCAVDLKLAPSRLQRLVVQYQKPTLKVKGANNKNEIKKSQIALTNNRTIPLLL